MKNRPPIPLRRILLAMAIFATTFSISQAATLWTGPETNFTQVAQSPPEADVLVPGKVSITRNFNHWLYNTNVEGGPGFGSPSDTEWAFGVLDINTYSNLSYQSFDSFRNGDLSAVLVAAPGNPEKPMVCHLINEDIYFQITFTSWPQGGGLIKYHRTTPSVVTPPPTVTVSISNPVPNEVFAAPANVKILASASVSSGAVTNVAFFGNNNLLGSSRSAPFAITNNLAVGSYNLKAVATAGGISATSSVVSITVVSPVQTSLSGASTASSSANNQFTFGYTVTPGLTYIVEGSSNLVNWTPLVTNIPASSPAFFTNPVSGNEKYFRVGRRPNP